MGMLKKSIWVLVISLFLFGLTVKAALTGSKAILVVPLQLKDKVLAYSISEINDLFFATNQLTNSSGQNYDSIKIFIEKSSAQQFGITGLCSKAIQVNIASTSNNLITDISLNASDIKTQLASQGINVENYAHVIYIVPSSNRRTEYDFSSRSSILYTDTQNISYNDAIKTIGHSLGLATAASDLDYGDIMSSSSISFNAATRDFLGWNLESSKVFTSSLSKTYTIADLDSKAFNSIYKVIKVPYTRRGENLNYYISYRRIMPFSPMDSISNLINNKETVQVHEIVSSFPFQTKLKNYIKTGQSYLDRETGIVVNFIKNRTKEFATIKVTNYGLVNLEVNQIDNLFKNDIISPSKNQVMILRLTNNSHRDIAISKLSLVLRDSISGLNMPSSLSTTINSVAYLSTLDSNNFINLNLGYVLRAGTTIDLPLSLNTALADKTSFSIRLMKLETVDSLRIYPNLIVNNDERKSITSISSPTLIYSKSSNPTTTETNSKPIDLSVTLKSSSLQPQYYEDTKIASVTMTLANNLLPNGASSSVVYDLVSKLTVPNELILDGFLPTNCTLNNSVIECRQSVLSAGNSSSKVFYFKTKANNSTVALPVSIGPAEVSWIPNPKQGRYEEVNLLNNKSNILQFTIIKKQIDLSINEVSVRNFTGTAYNPESLTLGPDQELSFGLRYANNKIGTNSLNTATNTYIEFTVPPELSYLPIVNTSTGLNYCSIDLNSLVTCPLGDLSSSSIRSLYSFFKLKAKPVSSNTQVKFGPIRIVSRSTTTVPAFLDINEANNLSKPITINVSATKPVSSSQADLTVSINPVLSSYQVQTPITVKLQTSNISDIGTGVRAYDLRTSLQVPANFRLVNEQSSSTCTQIDSNVICQISSLAPGSVSHSLVFDTLPIVGSDAAQNAIIGPAKVYSLNENLDKEFIDPNLLNNTSSTLTTTITKPIPGNYKRTIDISSWISIPSSEIKSGETVTVSMFMYNRIKPENGSQNYNIAYNPVAEMLLPPELTYISASSSEIIYDANTRMIRWTSRALLPGVSRAVDIKVQANSIQSKTISLGGMKVYSAATDINQAAIDLNESNNISTPVSLNIKVDLVLPDPVQAIDYNKDTLISIDEAILGRLNLQKGDKALDLNMDTLVNNSDLEILDSLATKYENYKIALKIIKVINPNNDLEISFLETIQTLLTITPAILNNLPLYDVNQDLNVTPVDILLIRQAFVAVGTLNSSLVYIYIIDKDKNLIIDAQEASEAKRELALLEVDPLNNAEILKKYDVNGDSQISTLEKDIYSLIISLAVATGESGT